MPTADTTAWLTVHCMCVRKKGARSGWFLFCCVGGGAPGIIIDVCSHFGRSWASKIYQNDCSLLMRAAAQKVGEWMSLSLSANCGTMTQITFPTTRTMLVEKRGIKIRFALCSVHRSTMHKIYLFKVEINKYAKHKRSWKNMQII